MCGIFAVLHDDNDNAVGDIRVEMIIGLRSVLHRGYDSIGLSLIHPNLVLKTCGRIEDIESRLNEIGTTSRNAMGHTRWATHGEVSLDNCHPHTSEDGRFLIVHNGILMNDHKFLEELKSKGVRLASSTDSELLVQWIGHHHATTTDSTVEECVQRLTAKIKGNFAFLLQDIETPDRLYCCRRGNPLLIGRRRRTAGGGYVVCSEKNGLNDCEYIMEPRDDRLIVLSPRYEYDAGDGVLLSTDDTHSEDDDRILDAAYSSWTEKEIREQPQIVDAILAARIGGDGHAIFDECDPHRAEIMRRQVECRHLFLVGCGTSYNAALASCQWFRGLNLFETVQAHDAVDFSMETIPRTDRIMWIFISQSGETLDLLLLLEQLPPQSLVIGFFNVRDSLLWRRCPYAVHIMAGCERGVASTKSFTCQVLHLYLFSRWMAGRPVDPDIHGVAATIRATLSRFSCLEAWIPKMRTVSSMLILGRKNGWIAAIESSLKMKELTRIHTEAYSSGSLKHGPFALLDEHMPVLYIHTEDSPVEKSILSLHEILARRSPVFLLAPASITGFPFFEHPDLHVILFPSHERMDFLSPILFIQEFSIRLSILKGFCVDFPRNLAKTVTVE